MRHRLYFILLLVWAAAACTSEDSQKDSGPADLQLSGQDAGLTDGAGLADTIPDEGQPADAALDGELPALTWASCSKVGWPNDYPFASSQVKCTTIDVPWDSTNPSGKQVSLRVARHESSTFPTGKALFYLAGGPGGTAVGTSGALPQLLPGIEEQFDLIYVDQRGTGGSGRLDCTGGYPETKEDWIACGNELAGTDLSHHLTTDAANDIDRVRQRLGYDQIYLIGVSYGTTVGLEYLRQHGDRVVAAVLDSVVPPDLDIMGQATQTIDHGIAQLVADCDNDPACLAVSPQLEEDLLARRQALQESPREVLADGVLMDEDETAYIQILSASLYMPGTRAKVPRAIHAAVEGDNSLWNALMSYLTGMSISDAPSSTADPLPSPSAHPLRVYRPFRLGTDYVAPGLFMTIACSEWLPASGGVTALQATFDATTWPQPEHLMFAESCSAWNVPAQEASFRTPVESTAPVLLLSGALDLRTWSEWATAAASHLENGTQLIVPYTGHATLNNACAATLALSFLTADGAGALDTSCLESIPAPAW